LKVLDVAAGSGVWSIPFAQAHRQTRVEALDFPAVLGVTRKVTENFGVAAQYEDIGGNWRQAKLAPDSYDVIILGHILHSEGAAASRELLTACHKAMKPGGTLLIAEFMPNQERTAPVAALLFAVNMYLLTTSGCVFSFDELSNLCKSAGFKAVYRHQGVEYDSPVVLASK
jgi:ubiquinone/menaquinone biosynthesis C-methylase UbiE